jgi:Big-like domain-containing protein
MPTAGAAPPQDRVRLLRALAGAAPAFAPKPIRVSPDMSSADRMIIALAEITPAFVPDFDTPSMHESEERRWYGKPLKMILTLGVLLGIAVAALVVLPHHMVSGRGAVQGTTAVSITTSTSPVQATATTVVSGSTSTAVVPPPALSGISITPSEVTLPFGERQQLKAIGTYGDGSTADITGQVEWASADVHVVEVDGAGMVAAVGNVPAEVLRIGVRATVEGISGSATVVVTPPAAPSTTTVTSTETTTVTTTVPSPTVTSTETTTVISTVSSTVPGPPVTQTFCLNGTTVTSPQSCPQP